MPAAAPAAHAPKQRFEEILLYVLAFRNAVHAGGFGGSTLKSTSEKISTDELLRNHATIEILYSGLVLMLFLVSMGYDIIVCKREVGAKQVCEDHMSGKKLALFVSGLSSAAGSALLFWQLPSVPETRNQNVMGFAVLFLLFSGFLTGGNASTANAVRGVANGLSRFGTFVGNTFRVPQLPSTRHAAENREPIASNVTLEIPDVPVVLSPSHTG